MSSPRSSSLTRRLKRRLSLPRPMAGWGSTLARKPLLRISRKSREQGRSCVTAPWAFSKCPHSPRVRSKPPKPTPRLPRLEPLRSSAGAIPLQRCISPASRTKSPTFPPAAALRSNFSPDASSPASRRLPTNDRFDSPPRHRRQLENVQDAGGHARLLLRLRASGRKLFSLRHRRRSTFYSAGRRGRSSAWHQDRHFRAGSLLGKRRRLHRRSFRRHARRSGLPLRHHRPLGTPPILRRN